MTMRDCPDGEMRDLLPLYVAGRLADADRVRVEAHIAVCPECAAETELLRNVARAYAVALVDSAAIAARLPARHPARPRVWRAARTAAPFHRQPLWRLAASLTLMIGAAAILTLARSKPGATTMDGRAPVAAEPAPVALGNSTPTAAPDTAPRQIASTKAIGLGVSLSDLTDAQLESLLSSLEKLDGNVLADPEVMARPIVSPGTDPDQGRN